MRDSDIQDNECGEAEQTSTSNRYVLGQLGFFVPFPNVRHIGVIPLLQRLLPTTLDARLAGLVPEAFLPNT